MGNSIDTSRIGEIKVKALRIIVYSAMALTLLLMLFVPTLVDGHLYLVMGIVSGQLLTITITYVYICCLPFLFALFSVKKICDLISRGESFSVKSVKQLSIIVWCCYIEAFISVLLIVISLVLFDVMFSLSFVVIGICGAVAIFATVLKELVKSAIRMREENELTI